MEDDTTKIENEDGHTLELTHDWINGKVEFKVTDNWGTSFMNLSEKDIPEIIHSLAKMLTVR